ncbi:MAG: hypothetical protein ACOY3Z_07900 [Thermodesulfobacteriota bacterium]
MLSLDVPFLPDADYVNCLRAHGSRISSLHFSLFLEEVADGRHRHDSTPFAALAAALKQLPGPKKYALLNSRFQHPSLYTDKDALGRLLNNLALLLADSCLHGVVIVDFYLLQALSDASPEVCAHMEAIPGVNCMLDSFDRIASYCRAIERTHFRSPGKLNLDRSLNRNLTALRQISALCREHFPDARLTLLANEGCLYRCPFKLTHDAQIAVSATGLGENRTFAINQELGCIRILSETPEELFRSPFIRPEDMRHYDGLVDVIKLCGRTLGPGFLSRVVTAYSQETYHGNLLDLLDTLEWLSPALSIDNQSLPPDYLEQLTGCDQHCEACGYCRRLYGTLARKKKLTLPDLRS